MAPHLYVHIPFCLKRCPYCDFYSTSNSHITTNKYASAIVEEIRQSAEEHYHSPSSTLYFGGGTPSMLEPCNVEHIIQASQKHFHLLEDAEITMEINPGTVDLLKLQEYFSAGINRISIGVQTFDDILLKRLGRIHGLVDIENTLASVAEAGFENISLDLIYGIPGQELNGWIMDVKKAAGFKPQHISLYALTLQNGIEWELPEQDAVADMYYAALDELNAAGFEQYELSNFALEGCECAHNMGYWLKHDYLGFGPSAVSTKWRGSGSENSLRWKNREDLEEYVGLLGNGQRPSREYEEISPEDEIREEIMLSLRLKRGMPEILPEKAEQIPGFEGIRQKLNELMEDGLVEKGAEDGWVRLSRNSLCVANEVIIRLF